MKRIIAMLVATCFAFSGTAFAASHAGGKMDDKKGAMAKDDMKKDVEDSEKAVHIKKQAHDESRLGDAGDVGSVSGKKTIEI